MDSNDAALATAIRDAANALCLAMNAAGRAGLKISFDVRPHYSSKTGATDDYKYTLDLYRKTYL